MTPEAPGAPQSRRRYNDQHSNRCPEDRPVMAGGEKRRSNGDEDRIRSDQEKDENGYSPTVTFWGDYPGLRERPLA
jgi:hypothetical protein